MIPCPACSAPISEDRLICPSCFTDLADETTINLFAKELQVFTTENPRSIQVETEVGIVFGNSSVQAFWGFSTQANRLSRAYEAALANLKFNAKELGADAVVGVRFALNNSTGSSAALAGSSEAVMLLGTAVKTLKS